MPAKAKPPEHATEPVAALPLETTVGHLLRRAQQVHTSLWAAEFGGDLTGPQYALLSALTQKAVVDQRSAGRLASLDTSTAADVIARLQRDGWLSRDRDDADRRRYLLKLTPSGRTALQYITPRVADVQDKLLEPLTAQARQRFTQVLARMAYGGDPPEAPSASSRSRALPLPTTPGHLLRRSEQAHDLHWAQRVGSVLTPSQYGLLSALAWNAPTDQGTAGNLASLDKSTTADIVARLTRRGLVESTSDARDGRRKLVVLTDKARAVLDGVTPAVALVQRDVTAPLQKPDAEVLGRLLHDVAYR